MALCFVAFSVSFVHASDSDETALHDARYKQNMKIIKAKQAEQEAARQATLKAAQQKADDAARDRALDGLDKETSGSSIQK